MGRVKGSSNKSSGEIREQKRKAHRTLKFVSWIIQLAAEAVLGFLLVRLGMLSTPLLIAVIVLMVLLLVLTFFLFGLRKKHHHSKFETKHIVGIIISIAVIAISVFGSFFASKIIGTVSEVTRPIMPSSTVAVYVLNEDSATDITHARDYEFGFSKAYDSEHITSTIDAINEELTKEIATKEYEDVFSMVNALLEGEQQAIILNKAYASLLDDLEEYEGFLENTRIIYEKSFVKEIPAEEEDEEEPEKKISDGAFIIYLSGSDTRSYYLTTSRSDVNILAAVNPETKEILLVNTPRDYYVPISVGGGAYDKLTHCGIYGVDCSRDTLEALYGVDIAYTAQINFTGVERLVDAVGGVTVNSDVAFTTYNGYYIDYGENNLNGEAALGFARERYKLSGGDNDRGRNQMKVLTGVIKKLTSSTALLENYAGILDSISGMFVTDMSYNNIADLVKLQLSDGGDWTINNYAVAGRGGSSTSTYSMPGWNLYVMYQNDNAVAKAKYLMEKVLMGEHLTPEDMI
ncbi:MAG: LCP family protein [Firmicutes bacterium]|nr:LCP family protein [Bacillota bacterium]